jgi:hypothetical protein
MLVSEGKIGTLEMLSIVADFPVLSQPMTQITGCGYFSTNSFVVILGCSVRSCETNQPYTWSKAVELMLGPAFAVSLLLLLGEVAVKKEKLI